mmetsp:Transcript_24583/g.80333  ORF Transcript_24583/g.80333 Transcript_24583/m.80333 type:complete len:383 (-) Transcript_24583:2178-3326(-)
MRGAVRKAARPVSAEPEPVPDAHFARGFELGAREVAREGCARLRPHPVREPRHPMRLAVEGPRVAPHQLEVRGKVARRNVPAAVHRPLHLLHVHRVLNLLVVHGQLVHGREALENVGLRHVHRHHAQGADDELAALLERPALLLGPLLGVSARVAAGVGFGARARLARHAAPAMSNGGCSLASQQRERHEFAGPLFRVRGGNRLERCRRRRINFAELRINLVLDVERQRREGLRSLERSLRLCEEELAQLLRVAKPLRVARVDGLRVGQHQLNVPEERLDALVPAGAAAAELLRYAPQVHRHVHDALIRRLLALRGCPHETIADAPASLTILELLHRRHNLCTALSKLLLYARPVDLLDDHGVDALRRLCSLLRLASGVVRL